MLFMAAPPYLMCGDNVAGFKVTLRCRLDDEQTNADAGNAWLHSKILWTVIILLFPHHEVVLIDRRQPAGDRCEYRPWTETRWLKHDHIQTSRFTA